MTHPINKKCYHLLPQPTSLADLGILLPVPLVEDDERFTHICGYSVLGHIVLLDPESSDYRLFTPYSQHLSLMMPIDTLEAFTTLLLDSDGYRRDIYREDFFAQLVSAYGELNEEEVFAPKTTDLYDDFRDDNVENFHKINVRKMLEEAFYFFRGDSIATEQCLKALQEKIDPLLKQAKALERTQPEQAFALYQQVFNLIEQVRVEDSDFTGIIERSFIHVLEKFARNHTLRNKTTDTNVQALEYLELGNLYGFELIKDIDEENDDTCRYPSEFFDYLAFRVKLLKALNRLEEAYPIVQALFELDIEQDEYRLINDIHNSSDYQSWFREKPLELSDDEKAFLQKAKRIRQNIPTSVIPNDVDASNANVHYDIISLDEAMKAHDFIGVCSGHNPHTLLIYGDYYADETIDDDWVRNKITTVVKDQFSSQFANPNDVEGVLFMDNLYINGNLNDDRDGMLLQVANNLYMNGFAFSCDGVIIIKGDAHIQYGICGEYNDGSITIEGKLYTPYLLANDHAMPRSCGQESIYIEGGAEKETIAIGKSDDGSYGWGWRYFKSSYRLFNDDVWDDDDEFTVTTFFQLVRSGKNPFIDIDENGQLIEPTIPAKSDTSLIQRNGFTYAENGETYSRGKGIEAMIASLGEEYEEINHNNYSIEVKYAKRGISFRYKYNDNRKKVFNIQLYAPFKGITDSGIELNVSTMDDVEALFNKLQFWSTEPHPDRQWASTLGLSYGFEKNSSHRIIDIITIESG